MSDLDSAEVIRARGRDYASAIDQCRTARDVDALYADALRTYGPDGIDWKQINGAILRRWVPSTLTQIKRRAWRSARAEHERSAGK